MKRLLLSITLVVANATALPAFCQGGGPSYTQDQVQLNQQLTSPQQPLQIIQQHQGVSNSSLKGLIDEMKGMVKDMVKVDTSTGDPKVRVKAPFVNVGVENGQPDVHVNAPFVHVTKSGGSPVSVKAPFTNIGDAGSSTTSRSSANPGNVRVKAPFVNVDTSAGVNVNAPFTNVNTNPPGSGTQAPPSNVDSDGATADPYQHMLPPPNKGTSDATP